jgi:SAM-dependent methyltransferase
MQSKQQVSEFYDTVGWQKVGADQYQNATYEDLRPVAQEYIERCHFRVNRHLAPSGRYLLDAGSGPVQYPAYLTYSKNYEYRVCLDISRVALQEARKRLGERGLYVVADVANLPFAADTFEGIVSLHTLHHLNLKDQQKAYRDLYRVLGKGCTAVIVNGWGDAPFMKRTMWMVRIAERLAHHSDKKKLFDGARHAEKKDTPQARGTFVEKSSAGWLHQSLRGAMSYRILVWRSVSVRWMRALIHPRLGGKFWLKFIFRMEELFPRFFGEKGQYPLVVIEK